MKAPWPPTHRNICTSTLEAQLGPPPRTSIGSLPIVDTTDAHRPVSTVKRRESVDELLQGPRVSGKPQPRNNALVQLIGDALVDEGTGRRAEADGCPVSSERTIFAQGSGYHFTYVPKGVHLRRMSTGDVRLRVVFYRSDSGSEPVRRWLKSLPAWHKKAIGEDIKTVELGWPLGMPLVEWLSAYLWEVLPRCRTGLRG